jgi:hypothetical protein
VLVRKNKKKQETKRHWKYGSPDRPMRSSKPPAFKRKVIALSATGMSVKAIAERTGIAQNTAHRILQEPEEELILNQSKLELKAASRTALEVLISHMVKDKEDDFARKAQ